MTQVISLIDRLPRETDPCPVPENFDSWLIEFIERMPIDEIDDEFQRGYFAALMTCYEARGLDCGDARYLAGKRLLRRMHEACDDD